LRDGVAMSEKVPSPAELVSTFGLVPPKADMGSTSMMSAPAIGAPEVSTTFPASWTPGKR